MEKDYPLELSLAGDAPRPRIQDLLGGETLLRLHPHWFVETFTRERDRVSTRLRDYASEATFDLQYHVRGDRNGLPTLIFAKGPFQEIRFYDKDGMLYARVVSDQNITALEEAFGLILWLRGIREYIRLYLTDSFNTRFFRILMNRVMLRMNPSQRKICIMIYKITVVEIILILAIIIGFIVFNR